MEKIGELKERGNSFMKSTPPDYHKAISAYTEALNVDAHCHTVLSNRSLAYYKLEKYQEALMDAEKAVIASPKWPKGYLRKCSALNALQRSHEAQQVAQQGFVLMHSTSFCREFVMQWLKACREWYSNDRLVQLLPPGPAQLCKVMLQKAEFSGKPVVPDGLTILSDAYWRVLFFCMASKISPMLSLSHEAMMQYMAVISDEFERIMNLFGHAGGNTMKEWADLAGETIDANLVKQIRSQSLKVTENLIEFLNSSVHPALYAVVNSLLLLAVTVVTARMFVLNSSNTGFYSICHMANMFLPFFESYLKSPELVCHHMNVLAGLIDSYNRRTASLMLEDCTVLASHCKKLESLLPILSSQFPEAYQQLHRPFEYIIGSAKTAILSKNTGVTIPFSSSSSEDPLESAKNQMKAILQKPVDLVTISDAEQLISYVGK